MVIIWACHQLSPWHQQTAKLVVENVDSSKGRNEFWIFFWWSLQLPVVGGWLGVTYLSVLLVCIPSRFIRFISFGHWGWPGCVTSFHELWNEPTFLRWRLWFIQFCRESTILLRHHQRERHVWVLLLVSTLVIFDGVLLNPHLCSSPQMQLNFSVLIVGVIYTKHFFM